MMILWRTAGPRRARWGVMVWISWTVACIGGGSADDTSPGDGTTADTAGETHEPPSDCATDPPCAVEALCEATTCGGKVASINHFGCARTTCGADADCPAGEACYPRAMGASCLPSDVTCTDAEGSCECAITEDCNGVLGAHCLPTEFYPVEGYCDPSVFECTQLPQWHDALRMTLAHHEGAGRTELSGRLSDCSVTVAGARAACGEDPCAVLCGLSLCEGTDAATCIASCEAGGLPAAELEALTVALAAQGSPACVCDVCEAGAACEATWGC